MGESWLARRVFVQFVSTYVANRVSTNHDLPR